MSPSNALLPPQALDAEESVLGACLLSPHAVDACMDILEGREFYRDSNSRVYRAIVDVHTRNEAVDVITVSNELTRTGDLESIGGEGRLHEIAVLMPTASNAKHHANVVRETWLARGLVKTGMELQRLGYERQGPIEDVYAEGDKLMVEIQSFLEKKSDRVFTGRQLAEDFMRRLNTPVEVDGGVRTPFTWLPSLQGGRLHVLGGYMGDGKSALALQFLRSACEGGARVGFLSIEMARQDVTDRMVASFGVPYSQILNRRIDDQYLPRLTEALQAISTWDWELVDDQEINPGQVRRDQRRGRYDFLIVDHLHRIRVRDKKYERQELEDGVRRITNIAREFDIPILLLAQLSRGGDKKDPFPRPTMADLRGTAMIEAEAAMVWFVWRKRDAQQQPGSEAEFVSAKNRFGPVGWHRLGFLGNQVRFTEQAA